MLGCLRWILLGKNTITNYKYFPRPGALGSYQTDRDGSHGYGARLYLPWVLKSGTHSYPTLVKPCSAVGIGRSIMNSLVQSTPFTAHAVEPWQCITPSTMKIRFEKWGTERKLPNQIPILEGSEAPNHPFRKGKEHQKRN